LVSPGAFVGFSRSETPPFGRGYPRRALTHRRLGDWGSSSFFGKDSSMLKICVAVLGTALVGLTVAAWSGPVFEHGPSSGPAPGYSGEEMQAIAAQTEKLNQLIAGQNVVSRSIQEAKRDLIQGLSLREATAKVYATAVHHNPRHLSNLAESYPLLSAKERVARNLIGHLRQDIEVGRFHPATARTIERAEEDLRSALFLQWCLGTSVDT
jgi:hypothetical protein